MFKVQSNELGTVKEEVKKSAITKKEMEEI